jgi:ATP-dependent Clp protease adaptor protein ClpS
MATAPPDTDTIVLPEEKTDNALDQPWHVVVFNDPVNLMGYVTMILRRVFGYSDEVASRMMMDVHHKGQCIVWTGQREKAEYYVQQLHAAQLLASMKKAG